MAKVSPLWSSFYARTNQPVLHHPGVQECPDEFQQPLVLDPLGDLTHQFVVIDPIEGHHDTLPIISTFPNASPSPVRIIRFKDSLSRSFDKHACRPACSSSSFCRTEASRSSPPTGPISKLLPAFRKALRYSARWMTSYVFAA